MHKPRFIVKSSPKNMRKCCISNNQLIFKKKRANAKECIVSQIFKKNKSISQEKKKEISNRELVILD